MFALIDSNGTVLETAPIDFPIVGDGEWIKFKGDRPAEGSVYDSSSKTFRMDISFAQASKLAELTAACGAAIVGGYESSALGSPHTYPSSTTDQINMMGSVTASLLPDLDAGWATPFWCKDANGEWGYGMHTAAQIQQAGSDGKAHVVACQTQLATLSAEVMGAADADAVEAIVWSPT